MSRGGKHEFRRITNPELRKEKRVMVRIPRRAMPGIKKLFVKYDIKGVQALFDILVVGGLCFRRADIIEFVRARKSKYKKESVKRNLAKLNKEKLEPRPDMYGINVSMYLADHRALKDYIIEENVKQQWVWGILFEDGFAQEEKCIIDFVIRAKALNISSRKKAVARLSKDEYVIALPPLEASMILDQITSEYDEGTFDDSIQALIKSKLALTAKQIDEIEDDKMEAALNKKIVSLRGVRAGRLGHITKPDLDID